MLRRPLPAVPHWRVVKLSADESQGGIAEAIARHDRAQSARPLLYTLPGADHHRLSVAFDPQHESWNVVHSASPQPQPVKSDTPPPAMSAASKLVSMLSSPASSASQSLISVDAAPPVSREPGVSQSTAPAATAVALSAADHSRSSARAPPLSATHTALLAKLSHAVDETTRAVLADETSSASVDDVVRRTLCSALARVLVDQFRHSRRTGLLSSKTVKQHLWEYVCAACMLDDMHVG